MIKSKILVIDDDKEVLSLITDILEKEFTVICASDTEEGYSKAIKSQPDLIILDIIIPKIGGVELCRILKEKPETRLIPIIMLTVESTETEKVIGLETGADDYITKPFSPKELIARIHALLRRVQSFKEGPEIIKSGPLEVNVISRIVTLNKKEIHLRPKEFDLLVNFLKKPNVVFTRQHLLESVLEYKVPVPTRTIDTHIKNLRTALGDFGKKIKTVFGYGFKFVP